MVLVKQAQKMGRRGPRARGLGIGGGIAGYDSLWWLFRSHTTWSYLTYQGCSEDKSNVLPCDINLCRCLKAVSMRGSPMKRTPEGAAGCPIATLPVESGPTSTLEFSVGGTGA